MKGRHEFGARMPRTDSPCTPDCPDRKVDCRVTCKRYADYAAKRADVYEKRREASLAKGPNGAKIAEQKAIKRRIKQRTR